MKLCFRRCCSFLSNNKSNIHNNSLSAASALSLTSSSSGTHNNSIGALYTRCLDPSTAPSNVVSASNDILPYLSTEQLPLRQQHFLLQSLAQRSIRHEGVMQKCLWNLFKAPAPPFLSSTPNRPSDLLDDSYELAVHTTAAFRVMTDQGFTNDPQMTAVALGRCIEFSALLSLGGVVDAYVGMMALNHLFFSLAETLHYNNNIKDGNTMKDFYEMEDEAVDDAALRSQPNTLDVLCSELEQRLQQLSSLQGKERQLTVMKSSTEVPATPAVSLEPSCDVEKELPLNKLGELLRAMSVVGVVHSSTFASLQRLTSFHLSSTSASHPTFLIDGIKHTVKIHERVADPLSYVEESYEIREGRRQLALFLSEELYKIPKLDRYLQHHPEELLSLRRLYEDTASSTPLSLALWNTIRCIRVAHRHTRTTDLRTFQPRGELLENKKYAVKRRPVTVDRSDEERFIPPAFKTWRSPQATRRGGHGAPRGTVRRVRFGTQRISRNYIKDKQKKYCPKSF